LESWQRRKRDFFGVTTSCIEVHVSQREWNIAFHRLGGPTGLVLRHADMRMVRMSLPWCQEDPPEVNQAGGFSVQARSRHAAIFPRRAVDHEQARLRSPAFFFEMMSKRRKGFPSEKHVKRGVRIVHGVKELTEKLGRNDLCPCGSGKRFKKCCMRSGCF
jgi:uncharacterized protein YchJ